MVCRLVAVSLFFPLKTVGKDKACERDCKLDVQATSGDSVRKGEKQLLSSFYVRATGGSWLCCLHVTSPHAHIHVRTLTYFAFFPRIFKEETLLQSRYMDYRPRRISINSQKRKKTRGQYPAIFTDLHMATAPAVRASVKT